jgi:hypothetical protein
MVAGFVLWAIGKRFLAVHIVISSPVTDPSTVTSDVPVLLNPYLIIFYVRKFPLKGGLL